MSYVKRTFRSYAPAFHKSTPNDRQRTDMVPVGTVTGNKNVFLFRAPYEILIDQISLVVSVALATDVNNYWSAQVVLISAGGPSGATQNLLASSVSLSGLAANTDKDLGPSQNTTLGPNDVLQLQLTKNGVPVNLQDLMVALDYEVTGTTTTTSTSTTTTTTTTTTVSTSSTTTTTTSTSSTTTIT